MAFSKQPHASVKTLLRRFQKCRRLCSYFSNAILSFCTVQVLIHQVQGATVRICKLFASEFFFCINTRRDPNIRSANEFSCTLSGTEKLHGAFKGTAIETGFTFAKSRNIKIFDVTSPTCQHQFNGTEVQDFLLCNIHCQCIQSSVLKLFVL